MRAPPYLQEDTMSLVGKWSGQWIGEPGSMKKLECEVTDTTLVITHGEEQEFDAVMSEFGEFRAGGAVHDH